MRYATKVVRAGQKAEPVTGAITLPIFQTATYALDEVGRDKGFDYSRSGTPTSRRLEEALTELEGGTGCVTFSSGMASILAVMCLLKKGDHVLVCDDLYGGSRRLFSQVLENLGLEFTYLDMTSLDNITRSIRETTRYVFLETPSNPTLKIVDIEETAKLIRNRGILLIVDNTFQTPYLQKPFELGADIVIHSLTKFLGGHHDVIGGAAVVKDPEILERLRFMLKSLGMPLAPFDSFLVWRGLKTLAVRMDRTNENALAIAQFLENHEKVERVIFPGLPTHPQYSIGKKQMTGPGGMISLELKGGVEAGINLMNKVKLWILAESLGGCDSLITHPASMTHASVPEEIRRDLGISDGFVRLSVGIEDRDDLIDDLASALAQ